MPSPVPGLLPNLLPDLLPSRRRYFPIVAGAAVLCAAVLSASTVSAETRLNQRVTVLSCPFAGVTGNCLMIKAADGTVYNISAVTPRPREHRHAIRLRGTVTDKMSAC